jgi:hypothetical protein
MEAFMSRFLACVVVEHRLLGLDRGDWLLLLGGPAIAALLLLFV